MIKHRFILIDIPGSSVVEINPWTTLAKGLPCQCLCVEEECEMEEKYPKNKKAHKSSAIPRKPLPKKTEESADSPYYLVIAFAFGILLCVSLCVLDYVSKDTTPTTDTTQTIEYFG